MQHKIPATELEFGSLLSYCPRPTKNETKYAKDVMIAIKNEKMIKLKDSRELHASKWIAKLLKNNIKLYEDVFNEQTVLIPVPRSSLMKSASLWPSLEIAKALGEEGFGVLRPILKREKKVVRSSTSKPEERPKPIEHCRSLSINKTRLPSKKIVLVDDIVTRGHTFMGSAWKVLEVYPDADIFCFSAMRTISNEENFKSLLDPVRGTIYYREETEDCLRRP